MKMKKMIMILLCLMLCGTALNAPAEAPAAGDSPFVTMADAMAGDPLTYTSSDYYIVLAQKDGALWRVDAQLDERYRELCDNLNAPETEDIGKAFEDLSAYVKTLPVASAEKPEDQPLSSAELEQYAGVKLKDLLADGFALEWAQGFTADEAEADARAEVLRPAGSDGTVYRLPFFLVYGEDTNGLLFSVSRGAWGYQSWADGNGETLRKAVEDGTWGEIALSGIIFSGFSQETASGLGGDINARYFPTEEQVAAIRTVKDAKQYDTIGYYSDNNDELILLINGTDRFWRATAKLDSHYRELSQALLGPEAEAAGRSSDELWEYENSLPVTVEALDRDHPPVITDTGAYIGKTVGELLSDGFRIFWFYATTPDEAKDEYDKVLFLPDGEGGEHEVHGFFSFDDYNEYCLLNMSLGLYEYYFTIPGTAETLEEALANGTFTDLKVTEMTYTGMSSAVEIDPGRQ